MKKTLILISLGLINLSNLYASGSFWGGFAAGTFSGFVGNEIAHHAHRPHREMVIHQSTKYVEVQRPQYVEVKTIKTEIALTEEKRLLEVENQRLSRKNSMLNNELIKTEDKNCKLSKKLLILEDKLADATTENTLLTKKIDTLTTKIDQLELSFERINKKLKKSL